VLTAYVGIRAQPHYRREAFAAGMRACGYDVRFGPPQRYEKGTVFVSWNRYEQNHPICSRIEQAGGVALIAENGFIKGPLDGGSYYALAIGGHNGSGRWHVGGSDRWNALGIELKPWRTVGEHILVAPNRSFGMPGMAMPPDWARDVEKRLRKVTDKPIRVRQHPGRTAPAVPLERDLESAWACVIWASSVGVKALIAGVPVICEAPHWICEGAAGRTLDIEVEQPCMRDRLQTLQSLAWAQWSVEELASGEPFRRLLLPDTEQAESAAAV
jgi:hypothetical protein